MRAAVSRAASITTAAPRLGSTYSRANALRVMGAATASASLEPCRLRPQPHVKHLRISSPHVPALSELIRNEPSKCRWLPVCAACGRASKTSSLRHDPLCLWRCLVWWWSWRVDVLSRACGVASPSTCTCTFFASELSSRQRPCAASLLRHFPVPSRQEDSERNVSDLHVEVAFLT